MSMKFHSPFLVYFVIHFLARELDRTYEKNHLGFEFMGLDGLSAVDARMGERAFGTKEI